MMQELQEQIGFSAGQIYNYLSNNGEATFSKMKKEFLKKVLQLTLDLNS